MDTLLDEPLRRSEDLTKSETVRTPLGAKKMKFEYDLCETVEVKVEPKKDTVDPDSVEYWLPPYIDMEEIESDMALGEEIMPMREWILAQSKVDMESKVEKTVRMDPPRRRSRKDNFGNGNVNPFGFD